jgi:hypothetical protein
VLTNDKVLGSGFYHLPTTGESVGDQERVTRFERPHRAIVAQEANMARDDVAELVAAGEGTPLARCAGPGASHQVARRTVEKHGALVMRVAFQHAIWQVSQTPGLECTGAVLKIDHLDGLSHVSLRALRLQIFSSRSQYHL